MEYTDIDVANDVICKYELLLDGWRYSFADVVKQRDEARRLAEQMNAAMGAFLSEQGICGDADDQDDVCQNEYCAYCDLARAAFRSMPWEEK